jgi:hypothetical protein
LVLLSLGLRGEGLVERHKRSDGFTTEDFEALSELIGISGGIIVTPNALSAASSLLRQIGEPEKSRLTAVVAMVAQGSREVFVPSVEAVAAPEYAYLGLSDAALLELDADGVLLTRDGRLAEAAARRGRDVVQCIPGEMAALRL